MARARQKRLRYTKRNALKGLLSLFGYDPPLNGTHAVDLYLNALKPLGLEAGDQLKPSLALPRPKTADGLQIGLSAGTTHANKQWPASSFADLAQRISKSQPNVSFTLLGGPNDREMLENIRSLYSGTNLSELDASQMSVEEMSQVIAGLDLFVGVDSGPTHIAAALEVPVVALFGPTSASRWGPRGAPHELVSLSLPCAPCTNMGGPRCPDAARNHECMRDLKPEQVEQAVLRVLQSSEARP